MSEWPEASESAMAAQDALDDAAWIGGELMARDARIAALEAEVERLREALIAQAYQCSDGARCWCMDRVIDGHDAACRQANAALAARAGEGDSWPH